MCETHKLLKLYKKITSNNKIKKEIEIREEVENKYLFADRISRQNKYMIRKD